MKEQVLLDSSIATLAARRDPIVLARLSLALDVLVPEVVYGEMFYGAYRHARLHASTKFLDLAELFVSQRQFKLLRANINSARICGAIRAELDAKAQPIQSNDIWIAALARQFSLTLLTRDGDFARVSGLT